MRDRGAAGTGGDRYVDAGWRQALPRPHVAPPEPKSWALSSSGACSDLAPQILALDPFSVDDSADDPDLAELAKDICGRCPLRARCLAYAMNNEPYGIWGGLDAAERLAVRGVPLPTYEERTEAARVRRMFAAGRSAEEVAAHYRVVRRTVERWRGDAGLVGSRQQPPAARESAG